MINFFTSQLSSISETVTANCVVFQTETKWWHDYKNDRFQNIEIDYKIESVCTANHQFVFDVDFSSLDNLSCSRSHNTAVREMVVEMIAWLIDC